MRLYFVFVKQQLFAINIVFVLKHFMY